MNLGGMPDWAKQIWGGVHTGGAFVLDLFGQKNLADKLTQLEDNAGMLPEWAGGSKPMGPPTGFVDKPEHVVLIAADGTSAVVDADQVVLYGTFARLDGNGYQSGGSPDDGRFSFGYHASDKGPLRLIVIKGSQKAASQVQGILFLGGTESAPPPPDSGGGGAKPVPAPASKLTPQQVLANWRAAGRKSIGGGDGLDLLGAESAEDKATDRGTWIFLGAAAALFGGLAWYGLK